MAGVLNSLGSEVHLVVHRGKAMINCNTLIFDSMYTKMVKSIIKIHRNMMGFSNIELYNVKKAVNLKKWRCHLWRRCGYHVIRTNPKCGGPQFQIQAYPQRGYPPFEDLGCKSHP